MYSAVYLQWAQDHEMRWVLNLCFGVGGHCCCLWFDSQNLQQINILLKPFCPRKRLKWCSKFTSYIETFEKILTLLITLDSVSISSHRRSWYFSAKTRCFAPDMVVNRGELPLPRNNRDDKSQSPNNPSAANLKGSPFGTWRMGSQDLCEVVNNHRDRKSAKQGCYPSKWPFWGLLAICKLGWSSN